MTGPTPPTDDEIDGTVPLSFPFEKNRKFTMEDFAPIFDATLFLPNFEPMALWHVAGIATSFYGHLVEGKKARTPERSGKWNHALYMLSVGQGGGLTGEGYVMFSAGFANDESRIVSGKFSLCKHEKVEGFGANHERGWHPGYCKHCGLDMSVDSGD